MNQLKLKDIIKITNGKLIMGDENELIENFSNNSRQIASGDVYLGIKGERLNGSIFFEETFKNGAKGAILQDIEITEDIAKKYNNKFILLVDDTVKAMQQIATYKRSFYDIPVIAITGSVGKTSTRDIVANVMATKYKTLKTKKNYNNHIGVPLTIFELKDEEALVIELGMNHLGEISVLTKIAKPTVAVITNVGTAHIGNLGSRENILKAKMEILEGLDEDGYVVINNDNDLLHEWYLENKDKYRIITYGIDNLSDFMAEDVALEGQRSTYTLKNKNEKVEVPVGGKHFVLNSLCAFAVASIFGISDNQVKKGILNFELTQNRMDIECLKNNITVIKDYYNANYDSMKAALEYLGGIKQNRKIAVLGDMLELGDYSENLHRMVGKEVVRNNVDILITVGNDAKYIAEEARKDVDIVIECKSNQEAIKEINKIKREGDYILLKASNGMKFGEILEGIE